MPLTLWNGVCLCFLLGRLSTVICSSSNVNTTCSAQPAKEGQLGAIDLYFQGIDFSADQFYIVLVKDYKDILQCGDYELKSVKTCIIPLAHGSFKSPGTADQNMTVIIPVVNHTLHHGMYVLETHFNGDYLSPTSCTFIVSPVMMTTTTMVPMTTTTATTPPATDATDRPTTDSTASVTTNNATQTTLKDCPTAAKILTDTTEGTQTPAVPIVVPTVLAVVIVAIVIAVIVVKRRKRQSYDQAPTAEDNCSWKNNDSKP